jgi:hypothetical protein
LPFQGEWQTGQKSIFSSIPNLIKEWQFSQGTFTLYEY